MLLVYPHFLSADSSSWSSCNIRTVVVFSLVLLALTMAAIRALYQVRDELRELKKLLRMSSDKPKSDFIANNQRKTDAK